MAACVNENHFDKFLELSEALVLIYKVPFCKVNNLFSAASLDTMCWYVDELAGSPGETALEFVLLMTVMSPPI